MNAVHADMWEAWIAVDLDRGMSYYSDAPELTYAYDGRLIKGVKALEDDLRPFFSTMASQDISFIESHTDVLSPTVVCINELYTASHTDTSGVVGQESVWAGTYVWVKRNCKWKMQHDHESSAQ